MSEKVKCKKKARLKEKSLYREKRVIEGKGKQSIHLKYLECLTETAELFLRMKFYFLCPYLHHLLFLKCNLNSLLHVSKCKWQKILFLKILLKALLIIYL